MNQAGTYNLVVSNTESGCTATASVTVVQNLTPPTANAGPPATLNCNIAQLTLNGSASNGSNLLIQWSTVNGNIVSGENTLNPVIDAPGAYTLLVTNWANGCTAQSTVNINADQNAPNAFAGDDNQLTCVQTSVQLSGSGSSTGAGITYQWVGNPGNIVSGASSMNPVVNAYGFYTLIVTNTSNGCTDADEVFVDDNIIYPNATILPAQQLNCTFSSVQLDAGASTQGNAIDFVWTTANGHIVSGNGTPYPEVDETGTYTLVVINTANSCTASASVTVTEDFSLPVATAVPAASITCQLPQTTLNGEGSSSGYPFFYEWTTVNGNILSGNLTLNPTVNQVGTYLLTVYNVENGCTSQASVQVITSQTFPTASAGAAQTITCAAPQSTLDGAGSSQGTPYAYVWSTQNGNIVSGANTLSPVVDAPGSYQLAVINTQTGCTAVASVEVGQNTALPQALAAPGGVLSCTATSVALDGTGSSEGAGFVYNWATSAGNIVSGQGTLHPVVSAVGVYILVVSNAANGCTASASTTVTADAGLPVANAGTADTLNCVVKQMVLNATASSQGAVYTYAWTGPGIVSGIHTLTPVVDVPGVYELLITNTSNGCTAISNVLVPADLVLPVAYAGPAAVLNCLQSVLNLNGNGSSSGPLFTYAWTASAGGNIQAGANMLTPAVNQPGTYTLQVSNIQNGCTALAAVAITQDTVHPLAGAGPPGLITCSNSIVTLSGGGSAGPAYGYLWTTANGSIASGANTLSPVVDAPGTYSLLVTDTLNGCTATSTVLVNKDANVPTAIVQAPEELTCVVQQIQLTGTGSTAGPFIQYDWTTANGNILSGATSLTPVVNAPGQYTLRVFNAANNCEALFSVNVLQNLTAPVAYAGAPAVLSCANPVLSLDGTGSSQGGQYVYLWTTVNGNIQSGAVTLTPQIDRSGNYNLLVTNTLNGCTAESSVQILLDQNSPQAEAGPSQALTCVASSVTLNGAGSSSGPGFTFTWTALNGGNLVSGANTLSPVVNAPGQYLLTVTNTNNQCTATAAVTVTQNTVEPVAVAGNPVTLTCTDPSIQLNGAGSSTGSPYSYVWTTLGGVILSGSNTLQPVIGAVGIYTLVVTDNTNGCTREASVQVLEDADAPIAVASTPGELTCNSTTLTLSGAGSSAGSNFDYLWTTSNGQILSGPSSLSPVINAPGTYQLLVTNSLNGCTETEAVNVTQNITAPQVDAGVASAITCSVTQLSLNGNASGGGQGVGYSWFTSNGNILSGSNMPTPVITSGGIYTLTVYDLYNGCSSTDQVTVPSDTQAPPIAIASPGLLTCSVLQVPIDATASAQGSAFSYAWSGLGIVSGAASLLPVVNQPGDYVLQVSNSVNGCTDTATVRVEQNTQAPQAEAGTGFELTCSVREGTLSAAGSASGLNISYLWSTSDGNIVSAATLSTPTVNAPGSYRLLVTNLLTGCTATDQALVTENTNYPDGLELTTDPPGCGGKPGVVRIDTVQGGVGPYLYSIDGGNTFLTANQFGNLSPGQYQLVVQDINGCEYEETFSFPEPLEPAVVMTPEIVLAYGESATLTALINIPLYEVDTIIWSPMERLTLTNKRNVVIARPFSTTEYTVTIVNDAGCTDRATVLVRVDDPTCGRPTPSVRTTRMERTMCF
ncbi:MAG: hypothetical protein IPH12_10865 [Saprospirales bacterium]|nr:hypothetical protein [Saprospirales bacterium]